MKKKLRNEESNLGNLDFEKLWEEGRPRVWRRKAEGRRFKRRKILILVLVLGFSANGPLVLCLRHSVYKPALAPPDYFYSLRQQIGPCIYMK